MINITQTRYIIISKDRKMLMAGNTTGRRLLPFTELMDKDRIMTYATKQQAISAIYKGEYSQYPRALKYGPESLEAHCVTSSLFSTEVVE